MDSAADSLIALSHIAVAQANARDPEDDDRSSSLSELEDDDQDDMLENPASTDPLVEPDSEAETERLEESPDKIPRSKPFGSTPSKLAQTVHVDERPEIESLTDSDVSSPISSQDDFDDLSDAPANGDDPVAAAGELRSPTKRKREEEEEEEEGQDRSRRRRTGSIASDEAKSEDSEDDEPDRLSREATVEADPALDAPEDDLDEEEEAQIDGDRVDSNDERPLKELKAGRTSRRRGKDELVTEADAAPDDVDAAEESEDAEVDDTEAAAKSEEEQATKHAAMESLLALERHFAALRDKLYDERIADINRELEQLAEPVSRHPEFNKQMDIVKAYRDAKFEQEQKLLVYKVGVLKNQSVGERSQLHSAYFQSVRDIRERHLERLSEHFYRIQRDRFKTETAIPSFIIPFPDKRSKQITQQMAYNKEVSITSGLAKYVGFPAAPELALAPEKEVEDDLQKMGISTQVRNVRPAQRGTSGYDSARVSSTAQEQYLEKNAWTNPQHPIHRDRLERLGVSRHNSNRSPLHNEPYLTPAQQRTAEQPALGNSASTIPEHPSAPASSTWNTPHDHSGNPARTEQQATVARLSSHSPLDIRRFPPHPSQHEPEPASQGTRVENNSSPLASRVALATSPARPILGLVDGLAPHHGSSPSRRPPGIAAGGGRVGIF